MSGTITVSAADWELHKRALALLNKMADDPKKGITFKRLAKEVEPTLQFSDMDMADRIQAPVLEKLTATEAKLAKIEAEREAEKLAREQQEHVGKISADVDTAAAKFGLSDEGKTKMTTRMQEKGSLDAEAAAAWVAAQQPKTGPSEGNGAFASPALNPWGSAEKDDSMERLHTDPIRWMEEEAIKALNENPLAA